MRELFSHRNKIKDIRTELQVTEFDKYTKNKLWDRIASWLKFGDAESNRHDSRKNIHNFFKDFYSEIIQIPRDQIPQVYNKQYADEVQVAIDEYNGGDNSTLILNNRVYSDLKIFFFDRATYNEILDIVELLLLAFNKPQDMQTSYFHDLFFNQKFQELKVGYQVYNDGKIYPAHSGKEYDAINEAMQQTTHIQKATQFLYDRKKESDYKNSIKESISAVEQACREITGNKNATLGQCLNTIDSDTLHPALKEAFNKLYGYTSDKGGVRHAEGIGEGDNVDFKEAEFMLVACSAFVNYLHAKQGVNNTEKG